MKFVKVRNVKKKDLSLDREVWESNKGENFSLCSCKTCIKKAHIGAEVQVAEENGGKESYLVPLCQECNNKMEEYYVAIHDLLTLNNKLIKNI